jgi:endonuclease YncB( thermonuclease family)
VVALLVIALTVLNPIKRFPEYIPGLVEATATRTITGPVTRVRDGDTILVKGVPVRFGSLDCAEMDTAAGREAKVAMQVLVNGYNVSCHLNGGRSYDRWIAACFREDGQELASAMMKVGYCRRYW